MASYEDYYKLRASHADVFKDLEPNLLHHVFQDGVVARLGTLEPEQCPVIMFQPGLWNPDNWPIMDIFRANVIVIEEILHASSTSEYKKVFLDNFV